MLTKSDEKKMAAAIFEGQESANILKTIISSNPTLAAHHVHTILHSFSVCHSLLNSHPESSSRRSKKRKRKSSAEKEEEEGFRFDRYDSPVLILNDGFSWKKYGQKVIKGFAHQRSYYRCSNCSVKKQVQKIHDTPPIFKITYIGYHKCQAKESSMMLRFDQPSTDCIDDQRPIPDFPIPVMNQEGCDGYDMLNDVWVSDQFDMMFSNNGYDLDRFQI